MTTDLAFHYPPDVFDAVVDAVPLLTRGKHDVVMCFRGCGVERAFLAGIDRRIDVEPKFSKYHITREILAYLNERGDPGLGPRREVLKRVSEFDDFSSCYPDNQMKARGAVATVAQLVNKKDSFTRMRDERERELQRHRDAHRAETEKQDAKRAHREQSKNDLFALFGEQNPHRRGRRSRASSTGSSSPKGSSSARPSNGATTTPAWAPLSRSTGSSSSATRCTSSR